MFIDISNPLVVVSGAALFLLTYAAWPNFTVKTKKLACNGFLVIDIAFTFSGQRWRKSAADNGQAPDPDVEFSIYFSFKRRL
jgi:hypothetical protein